MPVGFRDNAKRGLKRREPDVGCERPSTSAASRSTLPAENTRNLSTLFVPTLNAQLVVATYVQSSDAPNARQSAQTTAPDGAAKPNASPVPTRARTNPRRKSSASKVRVVFVDVIGGMFSHPSSTGRLELRSPPPSFWLP